MKSQHPPRRSDQMSLVNKSSLALEGSKPGLHLDTIIISQLCSCHIANTFLPSLKWCLYLGSKTVLVLSVEMELTVNNTVDFSLLCNFPASYFVMVRAHSIRPLRVFILWWNTMWYSYKGKDNRYIKILLRETEYSANWVFTRKFSWGGLHWLY